MNNLFELTKIKSCKRIKVLLKGSVSTGFDASLDTAPSSLSVLNRIWKGGGEVLGLGVEFWGRGQGLSSARWAPPPWCWSYRRSQCPTASTCPPLSPCWCPSPCALTANLSNSAAANLHEPSFWGHQLPTFTISQTDKRRLSSSPSVQVGGVRFLKPQGPRGDPTPFFSHHFWYCTVCWPHTVPLLGDRDPSLKVFSHMKVRGK